MNSLTYCQTSTKSDFQLYKIFIFFPHIAKTRFYQQVFIIFENVAKLIKYQKHHTKTKHFWYHQSIKMCDVNGDYSLKIKMIYNSSCHIVDKSTQVSHKKIFVLCVRTVHTCLILIGVVLTFFSLYSLTIHSRVVLWCGKKMDNLLFRLYDLYLVVFIYRFNFLPICIDR